MLNMEFSACVYTVNALTGHFISYPCYTANCYSKHLISNSHGSNSVNLGMYSTYGQGVEIY